MIRATTNNHNGTAAAAVANRNSLNTATLALWTPRPHPVGNNNNNNNNNAKRHHQIHGTAGASLVLPFPSAATAAGGGGPSTTTRMLHRGRHFQVTRRYQQQQQQVEVLTKLPSLYLKEHNSPVQPVTSQQPHQPLPLLHGSKRDRQARRLLPAGQLMDSTAEEAAEAADEATTVATSSADATDVQRKKQQQQQKKKSKLSFRISVDDIPQQQPQPQHAARTIPIAYFDRSGGESLRTARIEDADARSCDRRHPDRTVAYSRAADYIRDNELMSGAKARLIWRWIDEASEAGAVQRFVYDQGCQWFREDQ